MLSFKKQSRTVQQTDAQSVTESLYKQNLELAVKNKTLSLLSKLYEISILTLSPKELAKKISETIQADFNFEIVGIMLYDKVKDELTPLAFSESKRFREIENSFNVLIGTMDIPLPTKHSFFSGIINNKKIGYTEELQDIWKFSTPKGVFEKIRADGHIKSSIVYPLVIENRVIGVFILSLNRIYNQLATYEKESITSFINVISVALDKALIYKQLTITNDQLGRANERLKELDQQKSEFISLASHQLRSPLTAIKGYASLLLEGDFGQLPEKIRETVEIIYKSTQAMAVLVGDYLDVSRIEQGRMRYDYSNFDLKELVENIVDELRPTVAAAKLSIKFECNQSDNYMIHADMGKLKQVFLNLIDNSIKYTPKGGMEVSLNKDNQNKKITFRIKDTGIGIPGEVLPRLFEKFTRAPDANKVNIMGTGLGLYVAKKMIEAHGGKIWAESDGKDKGSTFVVELIGL